MAKVFNATRKVNATLKTKTLTGYGTSDSARSNTFTVSLDGTITIGSTSLNETQLQALLALLPLE